MKAVLLTGSTGFIGAHVTKALLDQGYQVYSIVRDKTKLFTMLPSSSTLTVFEGDLLSDRDLGRFRHDIATIDGLDAVIHMVGGGPLTSNPKFTGSIVDLNYKTTWNLIRVLQQSGKLDSLALLIYISSLAAMGLPTSRGNTIIYNENTSCNPVLPYEKAKFLTEEFLRQETEKHNFKAVVLRFPQVYGADNDSLMQMASLIRKGAFPVVRKRIGSLPVLHVADAVKATCLVVKNCAIIDRKFDVNVVCEGSYSYSIFDKLVKGRYGTGRTISVPYGILYVIVLLMEIVFKIAGRPEPLNRRRLVSMTKDRVVDCKKFVDTFNFKFDHDLPHFMCNSLS